MAVEPTSGNPVGINNNTSGNAPECFSQSFNPSYPPSKHSPAGNYFRNYPSQTTRHCVYEHEIEEKESANDVYDKLNRLLDRCRVPNTSLLRALLTLSSSSEGFQYGPVVFANVTKKVFREEIESNKVTDVAMDIFFSLLGSSAVPFPSKHSSRQPSSSTPTIPSLPTSQTPAHAQASHEPLTTPKPEPSRHSNLPHIHEKDSQRSRGNLDLHIKTPSKHSKGTSAR